MSPEVYKLINKGSETECLVSRQEACYKISFVNSVLHHDGCYFGV
jgi:hypothetical protein